MKYIEKRSQPYDLNNWIRNKPNLCYDNITKKRKKFIRKKLLEDQGYICCYCQKRITGIRKDNKIDTEIEHIKPQEFCSDIETVSYDNILVSCNGNQLKDNQFLVEQDRHCNNFRQSKALNINLLNNNCENKIYYDLNGGIYAVDNNQDIEDAIINLNLRILNTTRKAYINGFFTEEILATLDYNDLIKYEEYFSNKYEEDDKQMYREYAGIMMNILNQFRL